MSEEIVKSFIPSGNDSELIDVIKEDAIVSIKMSTGYYKRIQNVIAFLIEGKSVQEVQDSHKAIASRNITEPWIFQYETLLILCKEFEKAAHENKFIEKITIAELNGTIISLNPVPNFTPLTYTQIQNNILQINVILE